MARVIFVYFCYAWTLWTFLSWVPQFLLHQYHLRLSNSALFSSLVFSGGVAGDALGGIVSDWLLRRTGRVLRARRDLVIFGMAGSFICSAPILLLHSPLAAAICLSLTFFFAELTIGLCGPFPWISHPNLPAPPAA